MRPSSRRPAQALRTASSRERALRVNLTTASWCSSPNRSVLIFRKASTTSSRVARGSKAPVAVSLVPTFTALVPPSDVGEDLIYGLDHVRPRLPCRDVLIYHSV